MAALAARLRPREQDEPAAVVDGQIKRPTMALASADNKKRRDNSQTAMG